MNSLTIRHTTRYRYRRPVGFGEHCLMFRPRDSHDLRLVSASLVVAPTADIRWLHDVFGNSIAIAAFADEASELFLESTVVAEHFGLEEPDFAIESYARHLPFSYSEADRADLGPTVRCHFDDPDGQTAAFARRFAGDGAETAQVLAEMTRAIGREFLYERRTSKGTQDPASTLQSGKGTCRDFALLMMEAVRSLGLAARFVSGYLHDPFGADLEERVVGAGSTHAWVEVFLPGAGWAEFDPTNGTVGNANLIRVAVARDPSQAIPVQGTYLGSEDDFVGMDVEVTVTAT